MRCIAEGLRNEKNIEADADGNETSCLRSLLEVIPHQIWTATPDGSADYVSVQWLEFCGAKTEDFIGDKWFDYIHPDDRQDCRRQWARSVERRIPFERRVRLRRADGVYRWFFTQALPLYDTQGQLLKWVATNTNIDAQVSSAEKITRQKKNEKALTHLMASLLQPRLDKENLAERFRVIACRLTGSKHAYISEIHPEHYGNVLYTQAVRGVKYTGTVKRPITSLEDRAYPHLWGHSLNTGRGFFTNRPQEHSAWSGSRPPGHIPIANFLSVPAISSDVLYGQIALANKPEDYTEEDLQIMERLAGLYALSLERIRRREELEESRSKLHSIYKGLPDFTLVWKVRDGDFLLHDYNQDAFDMTKGQVAKLQGRFAREILTEAPQLHVDLKKTLNKKGAVEGFRDYRIPGTTRTLNLLVKYAYIEPDMILMHAEDVSLRVEMENHLRRAKEEAEAANRSKSEFLAIMSHELRTPLNGVLGMLQIMEMSDSDAEQQEYIQIALASGKSLLNIISDILDYSKIEAGRMVIRQERFCLRETLDSVLEIFKQQAAQQNLDLDYTIDANLPTNLTGDAVRLRQILFNLVGNAIKFTPRGRVRVRVAKSPEAGTEGRVCLAFSVTDTGIGIPKDKLDYIFEPFTQVDSSYHRRYEGSGLGLGIVKRLVELLGGTLGIQSTPGEGTSVIFKLDLLAIPEEKIESDDQPVEKRPGDDRILLVEDNWANRWTVMVMLKKFGYEVKGVGSGSEAIEELTKERYNLVLMDIQMPEMDGVQTTRMIRQDLQGKTPKDVPIVALTAHAMRGDRELFLAAGMNDYIAKPVIFRELKEIIARVLAQQTAAA